MLIKDHKNNRSPLLEVYTCLLEMARVLSSDQLLMTATVFRHKSISIVQLCHVVAWQILKGAQK